MQLNKIQATRRKYEPAKYIGQYFCENWNVSIFLEEKTNKLFLSAFWPRIELEYIGDNTFKLNKYPLNIKFEDGGLEFQGELIWEMKDKKFAKKNVNQKSLRRY